MLSNNMRNHIIIACIASLLMFGCKARQVSVRSVDSAAVSKSSTLVHAQETSGDTSKTIARIAITKGVVSVTNDTSHTITTIIPMSGTNFTLTTAGEITGQAQSIIIDKKNHINGNLTQTFDGLKTIASSGGLYASKLKDSARSTNDSVIYKSKIKSVNSKPSYGSWPWMIGLVIIVALLVVLWWFFGKPKAI